MHKRLGAATTAAIILGAGSAPAHHFDFERLYETPSAPELAALFEATARHGVGPHALYVEYCAWAPGVVLPPRIRDQHPEEIVIVFEREFTDLDARADAVHVTVSFDAVPARITIPLDAITAVWEPSIDFGVAYRDGETGAERCAPGPTAGLSSFGRDASSAARRRRRARPSPASRRAERPVPPPSGRARRGLSLSTLSRTLEASVSSFLIWRRRDRYRAASTTSSAA